LGIISVDTENHVICGAMTDFADTRDSTTTEKIVGQTIENLQDHELQVAEVLADMGYSSGETYEYLAAQDITAYIPTHAAYRTDKDGFTYDKDNDCYICSQGKKLTFRAIEGNNRAYRTWTADCKYCPVKTQCINKKGYKSLYDTIDKAHYDKAYKLLRTDKGKKKMRLRTATVEPVWGTLLHFRRMKKVYTFSQQTDFDGSGSVQFEEINGL